MSYSFDHLVSIRLRSGRVSTPAFGPTTAALSVAVGYDVQVLCRTGDRESSALGFEDMRQIDVRSVKVTPLPRIRVVNARVRGNDSSTYVNGKKGFLMVSEKWLRCVPPSTYSPTT